MATSLIIGEAIRKEKVTPRGTPASINPRNSGIAEQVQNGVIMPSKEAKILPTNSFLCESIFFIFDGGKNDLIIETIKIITINKIKIFTVSKIKKFTASAKTVLEVIFKTLYVNQFANS